jgi:hypothetical protein
MRGSYQPPLTMLLLGLSGLVPKFMQDQLLDVLANKASAVMTNVPGPQQPLYLAGQRIDQIMFWVPQSGDIGIGVSILSYNQTVQFGLIADRRFIPDPENVTPLFQAEFEKIVTGALLHHWVEPLDAQAFEEAIEIELGKRPRRAPKAEVVEPPLAAAPAKKTARKPAVPKKVASAAEPDQKPAAPPVVEAQTRIPKRFREL